VALVFERHATSKIYNFEDIYSVASFGFRGEAMPSIASIARVELLTRRKDDLEGTKATLEAGKIKEIAPAGCPAGTQISVNKIFANVPARRKFLKTEATEQGYVWMRLPDWLWPIRKSVLRLMLMDAMRLQRPRSGIPPNALPWSW